jgi:hypothetical protein
MQACTFSDLYLHIVLGCRNQQWIVSIVVANKTQRLRCSWASQNDSKQNEASLLMMTIDLLCLRVDQMPRSPDLAILGRTTDSQNQLLYPLRMRAEIPSSTYKHQVSCWTSELRYPSSSVLLIESHYNYYASCEDKASVYSVSYLPCNYGLEICTFLQGFYEDLLGFYESI